MNVFFNEDGRELDPLTTEVQEQEDALSFIPIGARVLELGARYGMVTTAIAQRARLVVAVEPYCRVHAALFRNLSSLRPRTYAVWPGTVSDRPMALAGEGYGTWSLFANSSTVPHISLQALQRMYGEFNCLVADCEGYLPLFFQQYPEFAKQLNTVLYEADGEINDVCVDYSDVEQLLFDSGMRRVVRNPSLDAWRVWKRCY